jgi:uncharacterized protein YqhQ
MNQRPSYEVEIYWAAKMTKSARVHLLHCSYLISKSNLEIGCNSVKRNGQSNLPMRCTTAFLLATILVIAMKISVNHESQFDYCKRMKMIKNGKTDSVN